MTYPYTEKIKIMPWPSFSSITSSNIFIPAYSSKTTSTISHTPSSLVSQKNNKFNNSTTNSKSSYSPAAKSSKNKWRKENNSNILTTSVRNSQFYDRFKYHHFIINFHFHYRVTPMYSTQPINLCLPTLNCHLLPEHSTLSIMTANNRFSNRLLLNHNCNSIFYNSNTPKNYQKYHN